MLVKDESEGEDKIEKQIKKETTSKMKEGKGRISLDCMTM
jgi:hypothetical protein